MDGLLDALTPLASLLARTSDPSAVSAVLTKALRSGDVDHVEASLRQHFGPDATGVLAALTTAGISGAGDMNELVRLAQAEVLALKIRRERRLAPSLVMTVPDFLRDTWAGHLREFPAADWPRETWPAMLDIASKAKSELLLAAPFFNVEQAKALAPQIARLAAARGVILVITQGASSPDSGPNAASVRILRAAVRVPNRMQVWSWPGPGLGVHFKALVADGQHAYLGSANLTSHGALHLAECGVILHGSLARQLDHWIRRIATAGSDRQVAT